MARHLLRPGTLMQSMQEEARGQAPFVALFVVLVFWVVAAFASPGLGRVATALLFVLGVVISGSIGGLATAMVAAAAASVCYNFYVSEPIRQFHFGSARDVMPFVAFSLCALVSGILAGRLKRESRAAHLSSKQLAGLLQISEALQSAVRPADIVSVMRSQTDLSATSKIHLYLSREGSFESCATDDRLDQMAQLTLQATQNPYRRDGLVAYRLQFGETFDGVLLFENADVTLLSSAFMSSLANLIVLAVERAALTEINAERRAQVRTEELKTALLSSVSHDFRTPLTAISASASSLIDLHDRLDAAARFRLLRGIVNECERLNRYTANLLEMSRLESGHDLTRRQEIGVAETLSAIIQRMRPRAGTRKIETECNDDRLLIAADAALFELVIINVLDNAITYSEDGTRIRVEAALEGQFCVITIADQGCGIPEADQRRIFERFYRVRRAEPSPRGSGLGLAIAKGFVEVMDGKISARAPGLEGLGTTIVIALPNVEKATRG